MSCYLIYRPFYSLLIETLHLYKSCTIVNTIISHHKLQLLCNHLPLYFYMLLAGTSRKESSLLLVCFSLLLCIREKKKKETSYCRYSHVEMALSIAKCSSCIVLSLTTHLKHSNKSRCIIYPRFQSVILYI